MKITSFVLPFLVAANTSATDLVLVGKDTPPAPIVVYQAAPPRTREVADVRAGYIEKMSGKRPLVMLGVSVKMVHALVEMLGGMAAKSNSLNSTETVDKARKQP